MAHDAGDSHRHELVVGPFRVSFAIGAEDRTEEYRLRYQYFVEECHFEPADSFPDGLERDEFDHASCALLLRDAQTGDPAGCQRLILPDHLPPGRLTNLEREYKPLAGQVGIVFSDLPRNGWAEASRTTVAHGYRWGGAETSMPAMVAIKYASIALAVAFGRSTLFSLSEPRTRRLIRRLGFPMLQVGAPVEFHGTRAPFRMDVDAMFRSVPAQDLAAVDTLIRGALVFVAEERARLGARRKTA